MNTTKILGSCNTEFEDCSEFTPEVQEKEIILAHGSHKDRELGPRKKKKREKVWINDPSVLFKKDNWWKFIPSKGMSNVDIINSFMRFGIYYFVLMVCIRRSLYDVFILIGTTAISLYLHKTYFPQLHPEQDFDVQNLTNEVAPDIKTKPTEHNPFMNTLLPEIGENKRRPEAEDQVKNERTKQEMNWYFDKNIYKDVEDIYDRNNSNTRFNTVPDTSEFGVGSGDKTTFANYLYNKPRPTCKENTKFCNNEWSLNTDFHNLTQQSQVLVPYEKTMTETNMLTDK